MGYRSGFSDNAYTVLIEHEIQGKGFTEIGKLHGYTNSNAAQLYRRALRIKKNLYFNEILEKTSLNPEHLKSIYDQKRELYAHSKYAIAFLEEKYDSILTPYREGEPSCPYPLSNYLYDFDDPPITIHPHRSELETWCGKYGYIKAKSWYSFGGYLFCRIELSPIEQQVNDLKAHGKTFAEIGNSLRITPEKAKCCFDSGKTVCARADEFSQTGSIDSLSLQPDLFD